MSNVLIPSDGISISMLNLRLSVAFDSISFVFALFAFNFLKNEFNYLASQKDRTRVENFEVVLSPEIAFRQAPNTCPID